MRLGMIPPPRSDRAGGTTVSPRCDSIARGGGVSERLTYREVSASPSFAARTVYIRMKEAMPKYVIERSIPGAGKLSDADLQGISSKSNSVLQQMNRSGKDVQWVESYVTPDKLYCVYNAPSEDAVREHAKLGGFPADSVARVTQVIDPTTAETKAK